MEKGNAEYRRGNIYKANLDPYTGSEQGGTRPVIVLQNDKGNRYSPTLVIAPISTKVNKKSRLSTHYRIKDEAGLPEESMVLLEQIRTIDKSRVIEYMGKASQSDMAGIDKALKSSLGLEEKREKNSA